MADSSCLAPEQHAALVRLSALPPLSRFYLAGGGAVAHHLGHRLSLDLDLFCGEPAADLGAAQRAIVAALGAEVIAASTVAVSLRAGSIALDLVHHPYPLLEAVTPGPAGFGVASLRDLATNKLAAIGKRGIYRDFWDLFVLVPVLEGGLDAALDDYVVRFGVAESDLYHVLRALTYFDDAEAESILPRGMTAALWQRIRGYFTETVPSIARRRWRE